MIVNTPALHILEIERFAIHDGPGIRTVVFLLGCPLRCPWCANPESWTQEKKRMYTETKCIRCGACASACPNGAIRWTLGELPVFTECAVSARCAEACPTGALRISGQTLTVDEVMQVVLRDQAYYRNSGGGLTVSGGEPFVQFDGLMSLLQCAKGAGLHTAIETTGQTSAQTFRQAEPLIDLFLLDFKHPDADVLAQVTGAKPEMIFENMAWLGKTAPDKALLRVPVIPGFNHDEQVMTALYTKARDMGFSKLHLLPYHTLGMDKYKQLGMESRWDEPHMLADKDLEPWRQLGRGMGLDVQ